LRIAACGNDCGACPRYTAKTEEDLLALARVWQKAGWRDCVVSAAEIACGGCDGARPCRHGIVGCAAERRLGTCAECGAYPCENLRRVFQRAEHYRERCRETLAPEWPPVLEKAFFEKKKNLDALHKERIGQETKR